MAKRRLKKLVKGSFLTGIAVVSALLVGQGALALFPQIAGTTMIIIGIVGLAVVSYIQFK